MRLRPVRGKYSTWTQEGQAKAEPEGRRTRGLEDRDPSRPVRVTTGSRSARGKGITWMQEGQVKTEPEPEDQRIRGPGDMEGPSGLVRATPVKSLVETKAKYQGLHPRGYGEDTPSNLGR